jgi:hypothetical protein
MAVCEHGNKHPGPSKAGNFLSDQIIIDYAKLCVIQSCYIVIPLVNLLQLLRGRVPGLL